MYPGVFMLERLMIEGSFAHGLPLLITVVVYVPFLPPCPMGSLPLKGVPIIVRPNISWPTHPWFLYPPFKENPFCPHPDTRLV